MTWWWLLLIPVAPITVATAFICAVYALLAWAGKGLTELEDEDD